MKRTRMTSMITASLAAITLFALSGCGGAAEADNDNSWNTATSVEDGGGMDALVAAAQAEGSFSVMGLYEDWANYGVLLDTFSERYGIEVVNDVSAGSSQDLINAVRNRVGQDNSLDYLDTGMSFAQDASEEGLLAPYTPATIADIPESMRAADNSWINQYGGTISIGCDTSRVDTCPTSFADLLDPQYNRQIAIPGDPTQGESGFMTVFAAAVANGGSLDDIGPGVDFFGELAQSGNLLQVEPSLGTIETGETPIVLNWDYLQLPNAQTLAEAGTEFTVTIPTDGSVSSFYAASVNADAPNPAVARLWMEFLFSDEGQNILLEGFVSPVRLAAMTEQGTANEAAAALLPEGSGEAEAPTLEQRTTASEVLAQRWAEAVAQ